MNELFKRNSNFKLTQKGTFTGTNPHPDFLPSISLFQFSISPNKKCAKKRGVDLRRQIFCNNNFPLAKIAQIRTTNFKVIKTFQLFNGDGKFAFSI